MDQYTDLTKFLGFAKKEMEGIKPPFCILTNLKGKEVRFM